MSFYCKTRALSSFAASSVHLWKGVFVGSGSDGMNHPEIANAVLSLTGKQADASDVHVLYLGTATYDLPGPRERQTQRFQEAGCEVYSLDVASHAPTKSEMEKLVAMADVILVSGGNTLFAVDRWIRLGLDAILREKGVMRGAVLTGGSAGAICWFQGGHSDSMDPDSYKANMMNVNNADQGGDESSSAPTSEQDTKHWDYIRVNGLGFLPGLICPHHDVTQSNGILRSADFDSMLLRHPTEFGIGIDHWAALELSGDGNYRVISLDTKIGSVLPDGTFSHKREGVPGIWLKHVQHDTVHSKLCPMNGNIKDILFEPKDDIIQDPRVNICRIENPDHGPTNDDS